MPKLKIIFDRSAFHGENFDLLQESQLLRLSKVYALSIYHTPIFLEETISLYLREKNRNELKKQLPFILEICNGRWFRRRSDLWIKELVEELDLKTRSLMPNLERKEIEGNINYLLTNENINDVDLAQVQAEKHIEKLKSFDNRRIFTEIREEFSPEYSKDKKRDMSEYEFSDWFINENIVPSAEVLINKHLETTEDKNKIFEKWKTNPNRFPYFTNYCKGMAYSLLYPFKYPNQKIDTNALIDIDQLTYLHSMDLIVSNDKSFMKSAFEFFYRNSDKAYFSTLEFLDFLKKEY